MIRGLAKWKKASAYVLFAITLATIAVMWQENAWVSASWATAEPQVAVACLAAFWLILYLIGADNLTFQVVMIPLAAVALWPLFQLGFGITMYRWATSVQLLYWVTNVAVVFVGIQIFSDAGARRWYLRALVVVGFVMGVVAPLQLFTGGGKIFWLITARHSDIALGPFLYANQYAAFIALLLPIALTEAIVDRSVWRPFHGLAAVVMYASIFASASRSGLAITSVEILAVPLMAARKTGFARRQLLAYGAVFLGMLVVLGLAVGTDRMTAKLKQKDPYVGRREYLESSLRMIRDQPLRGVGVGNWSAAYPAYATFDDGYFAIQAHNDWAQWAVEGGIPFALLMLWVAAWSYPRAFRSGWGLGVPVVFLQCLVDFPIQRMGVSVVFFTLIAAIAYPDDRSERAGRSGGWRVRRRGQD